MSGLSGLPHITPRTPPGDWRVQPPFGWWTVLLILVACLLLSVSARRMELDDVAGKLGGFTQDILGLQEDSQVGRGLDSVFGEMFPVRISERRPVDLVEGFDAQDLPPFARLETVTASETRLDPETLSMETIETETRYLIEPAGYLVFVLAKMFETVEIAVWASLFAVLFSLPLAWGCARNYTPHPALYGLCRTFVSFLRAVPELISALFLVLAFGFGPAAGILALGLHSIGFLAKFYADDIEAADRTPQDALRATGASQLAVLRLAVLPQVLPSYTALSLYILDRNIRMATVIGLVGAGGIGQELKGRYEMFQYDRVGTILLVIFVTVLILDQFAARIRRRII